MFIRVLSLFLSVVTLIWASTPTTISTIVTPNSKAIVQVYDSNYVVGLQTGSAIYWSTTLNSTHPNATILADTGNAVVTFKKGITVNILDNEGTFPSYIFLNGQVIDSQSVYDITGLVLGEFTTSIKELSNKKSLKLND